MTTDVLIIGGGIAGVSAALAAARGGAGVVLVRSGPGATALAAGGWTHSPPPEVRRALAAAGLHLVDCAGPLPHPDGRLIGAAVAPRSHAAAAFPAVGDPGDAPPRNGTLICGIAGLPAFRPSALSALWADAAGLPAPLPHVTLSVPDTPPGGWSIAALARLLERRPDMLGAELGRVARDYAADRVVLPAVLGTDAHDQLLEAVTSAAGVAVGEALGVSPSLPGWRLDRALLRTLETAGVSVMPGRVTAHHATAHVLHSVTVGSTTVTTAACVLATGKFIGGGIAMEHRFADTVFGTDISVVRHGRSFSKPDSVLVLTDAVRTEPQPVMGAGVSTDSDGRLLSADGDVAFSNVFVAGSVRAGVETAMSDLGTTAHDGWSAGLRAAGSGYTGGD